MATPPLTGSQGRKRSSAPTSSSVNARTSGDAERLARRRPWADIPVTLADVLRPALPAAIDTVITEVASAVPQYARDEGSAVETLRKGVGLALNRLLDLLGTDRDALENLSGLYVKIGAGEYRAGRDMHELLSAYQIGARASWRALSRTAVAAGATPAQIAQLAEAVFAYIDVLSATSTSGFAGAQVADAGRHERLSSELVTQILRGEAASHAARASADELRWTIPEELVAVVPRGDGFTVGLPGAILGTHEGTPVALLAGPLTRGLRDWLATAAPQDPMSVGLSMPASAAAASLTYAMALVDAQAEGTVFAEDHLAWLLVDSDRLLGARLRNHVLAPLADLTPERREPLMATLRSWLLHHGARAEVAAELHVHAQTVSYRMEKLREAFGDQLNDPTRRWELLLAMMTNNSR